MFLMFSSVQASYAPFISNQTSKSAPGCKETMLPEEVVTCIKETFKNDFKTALAVAKAESELRQEAVNYNTINGKVWSIDCGVFQVNNYYHKGACEMSAKENIQYAYDLYLKTGWESWAAYNNGSYLKHLQ